jgi:hypothetical protein
MISDNYVKIAIDLNACQDCDNYDERASDLKISYFYD